MPSALVTVPILLPTTETFTFSSFFLLSLFLTVPVMTSSFTAASCAINGVIPEDKNANKHPSVNPTKFFIRHVFKGFLLIRAVRKIKPYRMERKIQKK